MTNRDYINSMTTAQLMKFLRGFYACACCLNYWDCQLNDFEHNEADCNRGIKDWLDTDREITENQEMLKEQAIKRQQELEEIQKMDKFLIKKG